MGFFSELFVGFGDSEEEISGLRARSLGVAGLFVIGEDISFSGRPGFRESNFGVVGLAIDFGVCRLSLLGEFRRGEPAFGRDKSFGVFGSDSEFFPARSFGLLGIESVALVRGEMEVEARGGVVDDELGNSFFTLTGDDVVDFPRSSNGLDCARPSLLVPLLVETLRSLVLSILMLLLLLVLVLLVLLVLLLLALLLSVLSLLLAVSLFWVVWSVVLL